MNRALLVAMLRSRLMLPVAALVMAVMLRLSYLLRGSEAWSGSTGQRWSYVVCVFLLGSAMAALLGSDLAAPGPGSWNWLLARPVPRRRILQIRAASDALTLALILAVDVLVLGILPAQGTTLWAALFFWVVLHGLTAWAGSLGLNTMAASAVGFLMGALSLAAGLLSALGGSSLAGFNGIDVLVTTAIRYIAPETLSGGEADLSWVVLPSLAASTSLAALNGWRTAGRALQQSPRGLSVKLELLRIVGGLAAVCLLLTTAAGFAARQLPATGVSRERRLIAELSDGHVIAFERSPAGIPWIRRYDGSGALVWDKAMLEPCDSVAVRPALALMICGRLQLAFPAGSAPVELAITETPRPGPFLLSPDGRRLLYVDSQHRLRIRGLETPRPGLQLPDTGGLHTVQAAWGEDDVIRLVDTDTGSLQLHRGSDGARLKRLELGDSSRPDMRYDVTFADDMRLRIRARVKGASSGRTLLVAPDGSTLELPQLAHQFVAVVGNWPEEGVILSSWSGPDRFQLWSQVLDGAPRVIGEIRGMQRLWWTWRDPDGPGLLAYGRLAQQDDNRVVPIVAGAPGAGVPVDSALYEGVTTRDGAGSNPRGLLAFISGQAGAPQRIPWPSEPPFAAPELSATPMPPQPGE